MSNLSSAPGFPLSARRAAREARQARAAERAAKLAPIVKALQAAGITSLNGIAVSLNDVASAPRVGASGTPNRFRGC
jgi:hypothetical protein